MGQELRGLFSTQRTADLQLLSELIEARQGHADHRRNAPLREVPEAIRYLENGHARGKVVITV